MFAATGLKNGETQASVFIGNQVRVAGESVAGGPYLIQRGTLAVNSNYNLTAYTGANLTVTTAALNVTANDGSRLIADPNPPFSAAYSGFKFGENQSVLGGNLTFSTSATPASGLGNYPITPEGLASSNYNINYFSGNLRIDGANLTGATSTINLPELQRAGLPELRFSWGESPIIVSQAKSVGANLIAIGSVLDLDSLPATAAGPSVGNLARQWRLMDVSMQCRGVSPLQAFSCAGGL